MLNNAYMADAKGNYVGPAPATEGDLMVILNKLFDCSARLIDVRHRLDEKGDQVFGPVPTSGTNTDEVAPPPGSISSITGCLDSLSAEIERLHHAAARFDRL